MYLVVHRPPNPLSIFNLGLDKQVGNEIAVYHAFVPTIWDADKHGADNPFLNLFTSIAMEILLLALFVVVLLSGAYLAFVRVEV